MTKRVSDYGRTTTYAYTFSTPGTSNANLSYFLRSSTLTGAPNYGGWVKTTTEEDSRTLVDFSDYFGVLTATDSERNPASVVETVKSKNGITLILDDGTRVERPNVPLTTGADAFSAGLRPIEDIRAGDIVASRHSTRLETAWQRVEATFRWANKPLLDVRVKTAQGTAELIKVTPEHPFYMAGSG